MTENRAANRRYGRGGGRWIPDGYRPGDAAAELARLRAEREADEDRRQLEAQERGEQESLF